MASPLWIYLVCVVLVAVAACGEYAVGLGPASSIVFSTQPSTATAGETIEPPVEVMLRDAAGRPVVRGTVTVALDPNPCGWHLAGTLTAEVIDATAVFADLSLDKVGRGYTLLASADGASARSGLSLPRGMEVVHDTIYVLEGDAPNPIYVFSQRQP